MLGGVFRLCVCFWLVDVGIGYSERRGWEAGVWVYLAVSRVGYGR